MAAVPVGLQVMLLAPELPAAEAQPDQATGRVGLDPRRLDRRLSSLRIFWWTPCRSPFFPAFANSLPALRARPFRVSACKSWDSRAPETFPSRDTRTALNIRAGMPYSLTQPLFIDAADLPEETSAKRRLCTLPYSAA